MKNTLLAASIDITPLLKAKKALEAALAAPFNEFIRDAAIQRFEFTFELTWKTLRRILKYKGLEINNPRDVFRNAAQQGLIADPQQWFTFIENRNLTTHTYDEKIAMHIYQVLPTFNKALTELINKINSYE